MLRAFCLLLAFSLVSAAAPAQDSSAASNDFVTNARFSIDGNQKPMVSVIATVEDRRVGRPQYKSITLNFYAFPLTEENIAQAKAGDMKSIEKRIYEGGATAYNNSNAKIILSVDSNNNRINFVSMTVPGYGCTIAEEMTGDLKKFSENYSFENNRLKLQATGSHECNMIGKKVLFGWDFNVNTPVFERRAAE